MVVFAAKGRSKVEEKKLKRHGSFEALRDACETSQGSRGGEAQGRVIGYPPLSRASCSTERFFDGKQH